MQLTIENAEKVLKKYLYQDKNKMEHSIRVAKISKILAEKHHVLVDEAIIAALLHDIGKSMVKSKMLELCAIKGVILYDFEIFESLEALHGKTGAILFEREFNRELQPEKFDRIKHAISSHVAGADGLMSDLDKIIYIADNIEPEKIKRNESTTNNNLLSKTEELVKADMDECIKIIIEDKKQRAQAKGRIYNPMLDNMLLDDR